ncbi:T9SS type A sorting domain-containing protein [Rhodocytophaga rosea]|uniref:T9SS type A sorting domain-containing protein n=1 Tax=Rhodocytophaga rosea TaxID=2704465 RepID=A0A6C0GSE8_9BACT|nr:PA14 domain-containing protein [Rhodocytophaga rosea]QHT70877.1 T9SS type A sorting domain-containing protein [Rhodocytophaga rosea]
MIQTSDGGYLLAGTSSSGIGGDKTQASGGLDDYWIVKINKDGLKQSDRAFSGANNSSSGQGYDLLTDVIATSDGGYLLGGHSNSLIGGNKSAPFLGADDFWVIKLDNTLNKQWDKTYGGKGEDVLTSLINMPDGYILGGYSASKTGGDKTEDNKGDTDYWLIKVDQAGNKQWNKIFGGTGREELYSVIQTTDKGFLLTGNSASGISGDKTEPNRSPSSGSTDYWIVRTFTEISPIICSATGSILQEKWLNVTGSSVSAIPVTTSPSSSSELTSFETPSNQGDNYGERIRGYVCVPTTSSYIFYIAGDDKCELWLSTDEDPSKKTKIASVPYFTGAKVWNKYAEQKSVAISLVAGKKYYIEALHKEATGRDNLAVGWQSSATAPITVIPGSALSPFVIHTTGKISREFWSNVTGYQISNIPLTTAATTTDQITIFERATNQGDNYGQRFRGYIHPQVSGNYHFYIASDDKAELWLSTDEDPSKKTKIASLTAPSSLRQWNKYASQQSAAIALVAGRKYYIEALHKENTGNDHISVGWQLPTQTTISVIAGSYLSPFFTSPSSTIARVGVEESLPARINLYPNPFDSKLTLASEQIGKFYISVVDNLGRTVYQSFTHAMSAETTLDLAHLKAGVYVIKVSTEDGSTQVWRVVKK